MDFMISIFTEEQLRAMEKKEDFEEGLEQGLEQGILKVAKNMKEEGFPKEVILKLTKLPLDKIKTL